MSYNKKSEKYKGVYNWKDGRRSKSTKDGYWVATITRKGEKIRQSYKTEREAAIGYDKILINLGMEPVNILVRK